MQLQLLTAIVKLFLKKPQETQELVQKVLSLATQDSDNPDLRDRGYIYWRLLSTDPAAAKEVYCLLISFVFERNGQSFKFQHHMLPRILYQWQLIWRNRAESRKGSSRLSYFAEFSARTYRFMISNWKLRVAQLIELAVYNSR